MVKESLYEYQPQKEANKNVIKFKIEQLEESVENLRARIERINNPNLRRPLEVQLERKINDINILRDELVQLEKDIDKAEDKDSPVN